MPKVWLNYHHLYYFAAIAADGGVARAAARLRLGQSTLSTQLGQLESALDQTLFEREGRGLRLTEAGTVALEYAQEIFRLGDEMLDALRDRRTQGHLAVQLGAVDTLPKATVLKLVAAARRAGGTATCSVTLVEGLDEELLRQVKRSDLDLVLTSAPPPPGKRRGFRSRLVGRLEIGVYGARSFLRLRKGFPQSLQGKPFVLPVDGSRLRHEVDDFFRRQGVTIEVAVEAQDTSLRDVLGIAGHGLIVGSAPAAKGLFKIGALRGVFEELWLVAGERRIENPAAAKLMDLFEL